MDPVPRASAFHLLESVSFSSGFETRIVCCLEMTGILEIGDRFYSEFLDKERCMFTQQVQGADFFSIRVESCTFIYLSIHYYYLYFSSTLLR